jgi:RNA polymerase sigma factor (sigma-70 family)
MIDDGSLLKEYASSGSEPDFARLVERHLDLVYATALRIVGGDVMLAQDAAQAVFMDLARKARTLTHRTDLTGWLYRSACFAAAKLVRSERRRQVREQEAHQMQEQSSDPHPEPDWDALWAVLDEVMLELRESDREALLLRYFRGGSLADVGNKLGLNENAARMRVERALERLRGVLARRGLHSAGTALVAALTQQTICAAPAGLAATITGAALAGMVPGAGISLLSMITMTHTKSILLGALVVAGAVTPLAIQHRNHARQADEIASLRQLLSASARPGTPSPDRIDTDELERLRAERRELVRLRGEVASLRARLAETQSRLASATDPTPPSDTSRVEPLADLEMSEFLSYPAW